MSRVDFSHDLPTNLATAKSLPGFWHLIAFCLLQLMVTGTFATNAMGDEFPNDETPIVGWNGNYLVGRWTQVIVPVRVTESSPLQLELTAVDSDGNRVGFLSPEVNLPPGKHHLSGLLKVGRMDGEIGIRVGSQLKEIHGTPGHVKWLQLPYKPSARLIITVGKPGGFDFESEPSKYRSIVKVIPVKAEDLPINPMAFDGVAAVVVAGSYQLNSAQAEALREWVNSGGRLFISLSHDVNAAHSSTNWLANWFSMKLGDQPVVVREFGGLESFAGKNVRISHTGTLSIPSLKIEGGEILAASRMDPFLVRGAYGLGSVSVLAMDLTSSPLVDWKALSPFCARWIGLEQASENTEPGVVRGSQLSSTGITDLATQVHSIQDHFSSVERYSPWFVMSLIFALLIVVGPIDYLLVHRILQRPNLTWITYPCLVAMLALFATWLANGSNGTLQRANQLDILNIDAVSATARGRHFINLYSPTTSQSTISVEALDLTKGSNTSSAVRVSWQGVPESSFGGMFRDKALDNGAKYQQLPDGQLTQLPIMQWSSKALVANSLQSVEGLVQSELRATPTGRLTGTISHRFSKPIEDWMIVYKTVVYRQLKKKDDLETLPFPPNQIWRVEQPNVHSRELRPFLTGVITMATPRFGQNSVTDMSHQHNSYDPLSLDPATLIRILTFHQEVGGEHYTGLTNQILDEEDCSHLLRLGRAILFGRLSQPIATIQENGQPLVPDRQTSFVRLILPVTPSTEVIKDLRRVVPD